MGNDHLNHAIAIGYALIHRRRRLILHPIEYVHKWNQRVITTHECVIGTHECETRTREREMRTHEREAGTRECETGTRACEIGTHQREIETRAWSPRYDLAQRLAPRRAHASSHRSLR